ncbi:serpin B8-like [Paramacrobiotus metropolitanus]|uniref:serpin B8-like n=1 Tax=Paramacrobiotus metropolitanus TaxID=2943436 RepID=UPI002445F2A4|nr:serpin B8-like [Paramacrobiotus metropolitanus]
MEQLRGPVERLGYEMLHAGIHYIDQELESPNQNFVFGTFATASAAGLIYVGSGGKASHRLARILHFDKLFENRCTPELITIAFRQAVSALTKRPDRHFPMQDGKLSTAFQLVLAHRVFFRKGVQVTSEFFNKAAAFNLDVGEIEGLSDGQDMETLRREINAWVAKNTHGQIAEALPALALEQQQDALTNMFLISVTSLRGRWQEPFPPDCLHSDTFHNLDGTTVPVTFISCRSVHLPYYEDAYVRYVEVPYAENEASLALCMPLEPTKVSMATMLKRIKYGDLTKIGNQKRLRKVDLKVPVFRVEHVLNLKEFFERIGVESQQDDDLSRMVQAPLHSFRLTGAYHKCTFEIDEKGSSADFFDKEDSAAGTGARGRSHSVSSVAPVQRRLKSTLSDPVTFHAQYPFIFAVRHNPTGMLLCCGRVVDLKPAADAQRPEDDAGFARTDAQPAPHDPRGFLQRAKDFLEKERGLIGRKRTETL